MRVFSSLTNINSKAQKKIYISVPIIVWNYVYHMVIFICSTRKNVKLFYVTEKISYNIIKQSQWNLTQNDQ